MYALVLAAAGFPYPGGPFTRPLLVVGKVRRANHVQHGQQARAIPTAQGGEIGSLSGDLPKQLPHRAVLRGWSFRPGNARG